MGHDSDSPPAETTPARTPRHDGWTVQRQQAFLTALAACGCVTHACRAVGMSRESAYELKMRPSAIAFRAAWDAALDCSIGQLDDGVVSRSIHGVPRPIFYKGEQVGEWRYYDERLAMFLLRYRRPHRYCEPPPHWVPVGPPGIDDEPDDDEAMGRLDFHLDGLTDNGDPPSLSTESPRANDGVNFVNFVGNDELPQDDGEAAAASPRRDGAR